MASHWAGRIGLLLLLAALAPRLAAEARVESQDGDAESAEAATLALLPYRLGDEDVPAGYALRRTRAYTNDVDALAQVTAPQTDPSSLDSMLAPLLASGRVVRLHQGFDRPDDPAAGELGLNLVLFDSEQAAEEALNDPASFGVVHADDRLTPMEAPSLGDGSARFQIDTPIDVHHVEGRSDLVAWRRGRLLIGVIAAGTLEAVAAALPTAAELAQRADGRLAALPISPDTLGAPPSYMPSAAARLELYQLLLDRALPDDALGPELRAWKVDTVANAELLADSHLAAASIADPRELSERLLTDERRILGIVKGFEPEEAAADPPGSRLPSVWIGHHLHADADGAGEALRASLAELALRLYEEMALPEPPAVTDFSPSIDVGEEARAVGARVVFEDDVTVDLLSLRWRRGAVELFADVAVAAGTDGRALLERAVELHDAAYAEAPLPGY